MLYMRLKELHYKELFIYGAYVSIIGMGILSTTIDALRGSSDAFLDFGYTLFIFLAYKFTFKRKHIVSSAIILFWVSVFFEFMFLYINSVDFDIIFTILIPIIAFVSMPLRLIIINLTLFYLFLIVFLTYYYYAFPGHFILHNFKYIFAYFLAHLFMVAFGFFYYLSITESIRRLEALNRKNTLLLKEVHHRVKNNLNLMASILGLQELQTKDSSAKEALEGSRIRIESMAVLHDVLYKSSTQKSINLQHYINRLIINIIKSESSYDKVKFNCEIDPIDLSMSSMIQFGIMLNEMVTNSIKYVKSHNGIVEIDLKFKKLNNGYEFIYCDNGLEIDKNKLNSGFGISLIKLTIEQFNGNLTITTNEGLCYRVWFKELEEL